MPISTIWATRGCGAILWYLIYSSLVCGRCYGLSAFVFSLISGGNQISFQQVQTITQEQHSRSLSSLCFHGYVLFFDTFCFCNVLIFFVQCSCNNRCVMLWTKKCLAICLSVAETSMNIRDKVFKNGQNKIF